MGAGDRGRLAARGRGQGAGGPWRGWHLAPRAAQHLERLQSPLQAPPSSHPATCLAGTRSCAWGNPTQAAKSCNVLLVPITQLVSRVLHLVTCQDPYCP